MYKAVLFDLDGVLTVDATGTTSIIKYFVNEIKINEETFTKAYRKYNRDLLYGRVKHTDVWDSICSEIGKELDIQVLYDSFIATPMDFEILDIAKSLKAKGYVVGIVTDNKSDRVEYISREHSFNEIFDVIVISDTIGSGKKESKIFEETLCQIELDYENCILIDNNTDNLVVPAAEGMHTIYFDHNKRDIKQLKEQLYTLGCK
ncbi:HAD family hydrolase [Oceanirhabdus sp. W0125-5]|uniref:HAD family hydrolase n=1 Tax=Oceanirhabdus sp. W0125-5 TaxID=2999116 RepID=UPI0022F2AA9C|nr:HAD family hydrolase [Oceanirhabdus sp. W0125-5]WBW94986.1 HAD hydrolase-like protein [Oceanirhabdus sp. W0125-5]